MGQRRVVITGLGVVNALATEANQYFQALVDGTVGIDRIKAFDPSQFQSQVGAECGEFKMSKIVPKSYRKATKLMSRDIELAVVAADAAIRDADLKTRATNVGGPIDIDPKRVGVNIGAGLICCDLVELAAAVEHAVTDGQFDYKKWGREGMEALTPLWLLKYLPNMPGCHVSIIHDCQGPNNAVTCAEASGQLAIGEAQRIIARGAADVMIAGGAECKVNPMALLRQCLLGRTSTNYNDRPKEACRPFDRDADGAVVGEGAGIVVLEELEHARSRGARIYAEVRGFGASNNFGAAPRGQQVAHPTNFVDPEAEGTGIAIAMRKAMKQADVGAADVDALVPHGLAVPSGDAAEAAAIRSVFGDHSPEVPVLAVKGAVGNCGAGAAAIDVVTAVLALSKDAIPATANCENPVAEYGLNIATKTIEKSIRNAMTCCYTFGGQTAAMVFSKVESTA